MRKLKDYLKYDPIQYFADIVDLALVFWVEDLAGSTAKDPSRHVWEIFFALAILRKQQPDGSWIYKGNRPGDKQGEKYELLETWKKLNILVEKFGYDRRHRQIENACEYTLSYQTTEGDIRGILSNQYTPYYMGVMLEILIKAGYADDERVEKGFRWLESHRQLDGGWIIPMAMFKMNEYNQLCQKDPIPPDRSLQFSHMATGMVIRAFAVHPTRCNSIIAKEVGEMLKKRFFKKDTFTSRQAVGYWFKFQYPFWWTNLLTCMDSLWRIGFSQQDEDIQRGMQWFKENQNEDGGWSSGYGQKTQVESDGWIALAVCRMLNGYLE